MKKSTFFSFLSIAVLIPATLYLGTHLKGRWYYLTSTLVILESMLPFFLAFETRKPQARELVTIAVMCALAVVSRVAILIPNFKPTTAIIMIAGIALGPEAGFMTGAVTAFASNFFFSQGPWTPWQMLGYGVGGFLAGILFSTGKLKNNPVILALFGFFSIFLIVGPLLDCSSIFMMMSRVTPKYVIAVFSAGLPNNLIHAAACAVTMLLFSHPLLTKLERLKRKYGMMDVRKADT